MMAFADPSAADKQAEAAAALENLNAIRDFSSTSLRTITPLRSSRRKRPEQDERGADPTSTRRTVRSPTCKTSSARALAASPARARSPFIDLLLGATSFQAFTTNWDLLNSINENVAQWCQETEDLRAEVALQKATYAEQERIASEQSRSLVAALCRSKLRRSWRRCRPPTTA